MDGITQAAFIQAFAAVATFAAACLAAYLTWKAPQRAAQLAEQLRVANERAQLRRSEKMRLFQTLMDHRGRNISAPEPVNALNMIDVVFHDSDAVREAYGRFLTYANGLQFAAQRTSSYLEILVEIAKDLGFGTTVTKREIDRGYFPQIP